nr:MAG TPA: hypothetical protein [Caudoviricetes sp.]
MISAFLVGCFRTLNYSRSMGNGSLLRYSLKP